MKNINIVVSPEVSEVAPDLRIVKIQASVENRPTSSSLAAEMDALAAYVKDNYAIPDINARKGIAATRAAYKAMGKDPNRYRPSQEQMMRRIVNGKGLYTISSLVDVCNYVSVASGYSIGAFDTDKIAGTTLTLGIGRAGEPYEGIGRGVLNIEGMPVYRDDEGGVGTPTSDNERTKTDYATRNLTVCINIYGEEMNAADVAELYCDMLRRYCTASDITVEYY